MKKTAKYILAVIIAVGAVGAGIFYVIQPVSVRLTEISPQRAELFFTEQGIVSMGGTVQVFPTVQGEVVRRFIQEGQLVQRYQPLIAIDNTTTQIKIEQARHGIRGLRAQLENIDIEAEIIRQNLQTTLNSLQSELAVINAQAAQSNLAYENQAEIKAEQLRIQQVITEQHRHEVIRATDNLQRVNLLYTAGIAPGVDYDTAQAALNAAVSQYEAAQGQLALIAAGAVINNDEHFNAMRAAINTQIAGINQQLTQDTTSAARTHFEALIEVEQINLTLLELQMYNYVVSAPVGGFVSSFPNTNFASPASPIAEMTIWGDPVIEVYVSTQDIISLNDQVRLTLRRRIEDIEFYGTVSAVSGTAVVRLTPLGIEERKVRVRITPDIPEGVQLGAGFAVDTTFFILREEEQIVVPRTAVFRADGAYNVWLVQNGVASATQVTTGTELRTDVIITSGLQPGSYVITDANNVNIQEGTRVIDER